MRIILDYVHDEIKEAFEYQSKVNHFYILFRANVKYTKHDIALYPMLLTKIKQTNTQKVVQYLFLDNNFGDLPENVDDGSLLRYLRKVQRTVSLLKKRIKRGIAFDK